VDKLLDLQEVYALCG